MKSLNFLFFLRISLQKMICPKIRAFDDKNTPKKAKNPCGARVL